MDEETCRDPLYVVHSTPLKMRDQAERHCHNSRSFEATPQINIPTNEAPPSWTSQTPQSDTVLNDTNISESSAPMQTRTDEPMNELQRPPLDKPAEQLPPAWMDFYFRPLFLMSLSALLMLMIVALEVLHHMSQRNQGLVTASEDMHYAWTYGPTFGKCHPQITVRRETFF